MNNNNPINIDASTIDKLVDTLLKNGVKMSDLAGMALEVETKITYNGMQKKVAGFTIEQKIDYLMDAVARLLTSVTALEIMFNTHNSKLNLLRDMNNNTAGLALKTSEALQAHIRGNN